MEEDFEDFYQVEDDDDPKKMPTIAQFLNKKLQAIEEENKQIERGENEFGWACLPDIIMEKVFAHLSIRDRYSASLVCIQWNRGFHMQKTWAKFELDDTTLTRRKFNYYTGWQRILDHLRTQVCLFRVGKYIRKLVLSPMWNLFNLYEFMNMVSYYAERFEESGTSPCLLKINSLKFVFWCDMANREEFVYGTGGKLLEALKRLIMNLKDLRRLELIDLLLDPHEAIHLLDDACVILCEKLRSLTLINATKGHYELLHPGCFVNLSILKISPQNLSEEVVEMLSHNNSLRELHIIQNSYTEEAFAVNSKYWKKVGRKFKVFLRAKGKLDREIIWQENAPVCSIIYDCPLTRVSWSSMLTVIDFYTGTLKEYRHLGLPKFGSSRKFQDRADSALVLLCRKCPYLNKLQIRERISTSTALIIAALSPNLRQFYIRRNALILKCDFKFHKLELDYNFCLWIELNARDYLKVEREIGKLLCFKDWKALSDKQFKEISLKLPAY